METTTLSHISLSSRKYETAFKVLEYTRIASPIVLIVVFAVAFVATSIYSARHLTPPSKDAKGTGPGGRPLPKRTRSNMTVARKRQQISPRIASTFKWLSVGVLITFIADAAINLLHTLCNRSEQWWRGQATVVSFCFIFIFFIFFFAFFVPNSLLSFSFSFSVSSLSITPEVKPVHADVI
jgi:ATP-binding cassette, subfamily B, vacuolar membrane transporter HMT1/ACLQ